MNYRAVLLGGFAQLILLALVASYSSAAVLEDTPLGFQNALELQTKCFVTNPDPMENKIEVTFCAAYIAGVIDTLYADGICQVASELQVVTDNLLAFFTKTPDETLKVMPAALAVVIHGFNPTPAANVCFGAGQAV